MALLAYCLIVLACLSGCKRHPPANSNCQWPNEARGGRLDLSQSSDRQHLSEDAEFAEDLAIRYADSCCGLRSRNLEGIEYGQARDTCMAALFQKVGSMHKVPEEEVRRSLGRRRASFDLAVIVSFAFLYGWGASLLARWLYQRYGPSEGLPTIVVMTVLLSILASIAGVMLGEVWSGIWEIHRLGNDHISYRAARIPWSRHRLGLFVAGAAAFLLIAAFHRRRAMTRISKASNAASSSRFPRY